MNADAIVDLWGNPTDKSAIVSAFHDERKVESWLYHGFVVVERRHWSALAQFFKCARAKVECSKAVHFVDLSGSSRVSSRTRLAVHWSKALDGELLTLIRFFLLGLDLKKAEHRFFGGSDRTRSEREMHMYNRFFEMALYSALRWFFSDHSDVELRAIFAEKRDLPADDPFIHRAPYKINLRESNVRVTASEVTMVTAKARASEHPAAVLDALQLVDVLVGGFSVVLDATSRSCGCCEVADALLPRIRKMVESPYNVNSKSFKRLAMRFFPKQSAAFQLETYGQSWGELYEIRQLRYLEKNQQALL